MTNTHSEVFKNMPLTNNMTVIWYIKYYRLYAIQNITLIIINDSVTDVQPLFNTKPPRVSIVLHKIGDHYNDVSSNSTQPLWHVGHDAHDYDITVHEYDVKSTDIANETFNVDKATEEYDSNTPRDFLHILENQRKLNPKNFIIGSLNINSIRNKFESVEFSLKSGYIDLLALCETKLDESLPMNQFYVAEYTSIRNDQTASVGESMFYICSDISHRRCYDLEKGIDCHIGFEVIIMEVMFTSKDRWWYALGYKLPNIMISKFEDTFALLCNSGVPYMDSELRKLQYQRDMARNAKCKHPSRDIDITKI